MTMNRRLESWEIKYLKEFLNTIEEGIVIDILLPDEEEKPQAFRVWGAFTIYDLPYLYC